MRQQLISHKQRGLVSLEFALMFVIIFTLFYALIGYTMPFLLAATYQQLASEGVREAVRSSSIYSVDFNENPDLSVYQNGVEEVITQSWLPKKWAQTCADYGSYYLKVDNNQWSVCLRTAEVKKIVPVFKIFTWEIPSLPEEIKGEAHLRIR